MENRNKAARYPAMDDEESNAVDILNFLLDNRVKSEIASRDKVPNTDGFVEIVDSTGAAMGKIEVQVKKLHDEKTNPPKKRSKVETLNYARFCTAPFLFIGVDINELQAYWVELSHRFVNDLHLKPGQKTKTIHFPTENLIDRSASNYIDEWGEILKRHQTRVQNYPKIKQSYDELRDKANPAIGKERPEYNQIHQYLDQLNFYLDGPFKMLKDRHYPDAWKVGFAYSNYESNQVSFSIYPIPQNRNDIQIKETSSEIIENIKDTTQSRSLSRNPIAENPREFALKTLQKKISETIDPDLLSPTQSGFLGREYIFGFLDSFYEYMGLEKEDEYTITVLESGFRHLQFWVDEVINEIDMSKIQKKASEGGVIDPRVLDESRENKQDLHSEVEKRLPDEERTPNYNLGSHLLPPGQYEEFLQLFKDRNKHEINRPYISETPFFQNTNFEERIQNTRLFFEQQPKVYKQVLPPDLREESKLGLYDSSLMTIVLIHDEEPLNTGATIYQLLPIEGEPGYSIFARSNPLVKSLRNSISEPTKKIEINDEEYRFRAVTMTNLGINNPRLPMMDHIYEKLKSRMEDYLYDLNEKDTIELVESIWDRNRIL